MSAGRASAPFRGWQWAEIGLVILLIWTQVLLQVVLNRLLISGLVGLLLLGMLVHVASWIIPMVRARNADESGQAAALFGHGERPWVIASGVGVLLVGILLACAAVLDLMAHGYHQDAPASVGWALGVLVFGFVAAVFGNILVQSERIRVRRNAP